MNRLPTDIAVAYGIICLFMGIVAVFLVGVLWEWLT